MKLVAYRRNNLYMHGFIFNATNRHVSFAMHVREGLLRVYASYKYFKWPVYRLDDFRP